MSIKNLNFKELWLLIPIIALFLIVSCSKEDLVSSNNGAHYSDDQLFKESNSFWDNDIKVFEDLAHLKMEMKQLIDAIYDAPDQEAFLIQAISETNGNSLLEELKGPTLEKPSGVEFDNEEDVRTFLMIDGRMTDVQKLIFNKHYEVKIGNEILVLFNKDKYFTFPEGRIDIRNAFRVADRTLENPPMELIHPKDVQLLLTLEHYVKYNFTTDTTTTDTAEVRSITFYAISIVDRNVPCQAFTKTFEFDFRENETDLDNPTNPSTNRSDPHFGDWTINWGDGSTNTTENNASSFELDHTFPSLGSFDVTATVIYIAGNGELTYSNAYYYYCD